MKLIYHREAEAELVAAAKFYEARIPGLGAEFLDEFEQCVLTILEAPERWRPISGATRRYLMPRFPYGLYYRVGRDEVRILVIKHHRQHPEYGMGRQ